MQLRSRAAEEMAQMQDLQTEVELLRARSSLNETTRSNVQRVHIPTFNKDNPHLWFAQIERSFALCNIILDTVKFDLVSVHIEGDIEGEGQTQVLRFSSGSNPKLAYHWKCTKIHHK